MERLSGMDAFFLYAETPTQHLHVTLCAVLDPSAMPGGYSFEAIRDHIASRLDLVPPFTRRLQAMPLGIHHPVWVRDDRFDLDEHVFRAALPAPGDGHELARLTAQLASVPLDRTRPLWEMWVIEGLMNGRIGLIAKLHHAAIDGVAGVEQMVNFFDLEADPAPDAAPLAPTPPPTDPPGGVDGPPTNLELAAFGLASRARSITELGGLLSRTVASTLAVRRRRGQLDPLSSAEARGATPLVCPPTPLNGAIGARRAVSFAHLPLDDIRKVKEPFGATVNDVILTVCAGALRRYLQARHALPDAPLVAACPVNVRTEREQGPGNRISTMFSALHTEIADPVARLEATCRSAAAGKEEHNLFNPSTLTEWAEQADPTLARLVTGVYSRRDLANRHAPAINVMVSNIPGPPFPLYLAGARLERAYPMGQIMEGVGVNITLMSYCGGVDIGFMAAANLLPDVDDLAAEVEPAFAELLGALDQSSPAP